LRIRFNTNPVSRLEADLVACFAYEGDDKPLAVTDSRLAGVLAKRMAAEGFRGQPGDYVVWNNGNGGRSYAVIGLGRRREVAGEAIRSGAARAARIASARSVLSLALGIPLPDEGDLQTEVRAAAEGLYLGSYSFDRHLTDPSRKRVAPRSVQISARTKDGATARRALRLGEAGARAVELARDLVNEGPSRKAPPALARSASRQAKAAGLQCKVLTPEAIRRLRLNALLAVARGSKETARVVHLTYRPKKLSKRAPRIVLVGKGVTFDSGGLNLKPGDSMLTMKSDMAGAAAVLAAMTALPEVGCRAEVHGLLGLVENMTGAAAYKPGDILDTYSGKTVEVGNTDAEGRLVLCDLLAYAAARLRPTTVVDMATLTGACVVALGTLATGLFSRHDALADALLRAGEVAGEKIWRLPLYEEYLQQMQTGPADLRNIGKRWGGAITAALFLGEFVPRDLAWAHLDIAGPAFVEEDLPDAPTGGTGAGVLTLLRWLETV